jgi:hypothetical protein
MVKFGPEGGVIRNGIGGQPANYAYGTGTELRRAADELIPTVAEVAKTFG